MTQYDVTGMSCAACSARVEKAVSAVEGVTNCSVSLLTNSMGVEGTASAEEIIAAVTAAGYGAAVKNPAQGGASRQAREDSGDGETAAIKTRLLVSVGFLLVLMYISMGHRMFGFPVPAFLAENPVALGLAQLLLAAIVLVTNQRFFISGTKALFHGGPNMDTLVSMGSAAAFLWSTYVLFAMSAAQNLGDSSAAAELSGQLYFESSAMILTLITVGKLLESRAKGKTTDALKSLMRLSPKTATVLRDGREVEIPVEQVRRGDIFAVRPGESIPVDGILLEGTGAVNESALTGESIPVDKQPGDPVSAGTVNQAGYLKCEATRVGEDTTLSQIIRMVSDAAATKAPIAKLADKVAAVFVPAVIGIAAVTVAVWLLLGQTAGFALARGISVLVISCPCSLGLATPVAIMVGSGVGAKNGILFKTAASLEQAGRVQVVVLDKTGTVTEGSPRVTDIVPAEGISEESLLSAALAVEQHSEHPLAKAIVALAVEKGISAPEVSEFRALVGSGVTAKLEGRTVTGGSEMLLKSLTALPETMEAAGAAAGAQGKTPLYFALDGKLLGMIAVADVIKPDSACAVSELQKDGIQVVMLTGDNEKTAAAIGAQAGVDEVIAGVLPDGKEQVIRSLKKRGSVCMIGDGINDAPALTAADLGMAIGAGTEVAIDAADVVLMKSSLTDAVTALRLGRATLKNIRENLFWAFFYNSIGIPIAAGVLHGLGVTMNPMLGAAAMSLSSFCVVSNALRLNLFRPCAPMTGCAATECARAAEEMPAAAEAPAEPDAATDTAAENAVEAPDGNLTMEIEGMMCPHCENAVRTALSAIPEVTVLEVSHEKGIARLAAGETVTDEQLTAAVVAEDYAVTAIHRD